jgi:small GTP-binding protein
MATKKILLTGNLGVGKSSLFHQFIKNEFSEQYLTTIAKHCVTKWINTDTEKVELCIIDTAGEIDARKLPVKYWAEVNVVVYVVDATRQSTLNNIDSDVQFIRGILPNAIVKVVANKSDLLSLQSKAHLANHYTIDFFTSAKTGEQVEDLFTILVQATTAVGQH